ncbi:alpha/beta hydrolase [Caulobacter segnis]|uniref:Alpha/beta hydrolase fold protein n=2 Tax=Caulobacter segnis TaxID=88688 RepID=D5VGU3_CAUST|nr:alpha/beta hydrolase [Caulobacter segnis]ADG10536.1 alpha/beta hydrolase fold protein [Caulobacter segnis ATCC 21756]AVQ02255.1 alpha/beta hydrolase [Caulobacter segnis]
MTLSKALLTIGSRRGVLGSALAGGLATSLFADVKPTLADATGAAVHAPTRYVAVGDRKLAYRSIGSGRPIVLCTRFRGTMDDWDPLFLDSLVGQGFQVITFDYSGLGLSTGEKTLNPFSWAKDAGDLIQALDLDSVVLLGWSLGGIAAQAALSIFPQKINHLVLIGTVPPGPAAKLGEPLFYETAGRENDFEDEVVLFFEPKSPASRAAAKASHDRIAARKSDRSPAVPYQWAAANLGDKPKANPFPAPPILEILKSTSIPILHIGGDHDLICPVENWYALNEQLPTVQLLTYPRAGHGPQHQHPVAAAAHIAVFVKGEGDRRG